MKKYSKDREAISKLSPEQYRVTQEGYTERPGTGAYLNNKEPGIYVDIVSGEPLFASSDKFESGSGWPSFTKPIEPANISELRGETHGRTGVEVRSAHGDSHLGHVFSDGPMDLAVIWDMLTNTCTPASRATAAMVTLASRYPADTDMPK